jgi:hypothetical protein
LDLLREAFFMAGTNHSLLRLNAARRSGESKDKWCIFNNRRVKTREKGALAQNFPANIDNFLPAPRRKYNPTNG